MKANFETIKTDVLVIGSGAAGARAAIAASDAGANVVLLSKGEFGRSGCTAIATSHWMAYSAALGHADPQDNPKVHFEESVRRGGYILNQNLMKIIADEAPDRLLEMEKWGAKFDKKGDKFIQVVTAYSVYPRACSARVTEISREILTCLVKQVRKRDIKVIEKVMVTSLIQDNGVVVGAIGVDIQDLKVYVFEAKATVLATGGAGQLYARNVFHRDVTGEGYALAYRAGAKLVNLEFIQMFPLPIFPMPFPPNLWNLNPRLYNAQGEEFLEKYLPPGVTLAECFKQKAINRPFTSENESRYIDAAIVNEIREGRCTNNFGVYFDLTHHDPEVIERAAAAWFKKLLECGIMPVLDLRNSPIEITYVIQHFNGGVLINEHGETSVPGLFAAGEVAGGQHGADRLGGNALADCLVFGARAGMSAAASATSQCVKVAASLLESEYDRIFRSTEGKAGRHPGQIKKDIQKMMLFNVSAVRTRSSLEKTIGRLQSIRDEVVPYLEARSKEEIIDAFHVGCFCDVGEMIARSALCRTESRGPHYREDYPMKDDQNWIKMISVSKRNGEMKVDIQEPYMIVLPENN